MDIESTKLLGAGMFVLGVMDQESGLYFHRLYKFGKPDREHVFTMTMLGFALVEALALFALIIALLLLFVFEYYGRFLLTLLLF